MNTHRQQWLLTAIAILAWALTSAFAITSPLKMVLTISFLLYVPGKLLGRLILGTRPRWPVWSDLGLSVSLSLILLMFIGLMLSVGLPPLGITQPLSLAPLSLSIAGINLALLGANIIRRQLIFDGLATLPRPDLAANLAIALATLLPILSILGAITLNNGGSGLLAQIMLGLVCLLAIGLAWKDRPAHEFTLPYSLYMISLALLLSISLRGWHITGHDIMQEYEVFQLTSTHGLWSMEFLHDAYNACLSITILPTIFVKLTGLSDPYIYKIIYQCIFAFVPVIIYTIAARFSSKGVAFLAALLFITFPTFIPDLPMLARQETAFMLLVVALMVLFDQQLGHRPKSILVLLLLGGMVVSHYSTSYVMVAALVAAKFYETGLKLWWRYRHRNPAKLWMPLSWTSLIIISLFAYFWNTQITQTSQGISRTIRGIIAQAPHLLDKSYLTGHAAYGLTGKTNTPEQIFASYTKNAATLGRDMPADQYYPDTLTTQYPLVLRTETIAPLAWGGRVIASLHINVYDFIELGRQTYAKLLQALIVLAIVVVGILPRRTNRLPRQYVLIAMGFFTMILVQVILPPTLIDYGLLRLIHQAMIVLSFPIIIALMATLGWLHVPTAWRPRLIILGIIGFFAVLSGLVGSFVGGHKPALETSNTGFYYEAYYTHDDERASFEWLKNNTPIGSIVNADEFARRKMITYANIYPRPSLTPNTIGTDAYVYLSNANTATNKIPLYFDGNLIYIDIPQAFLSDNKDKLYSGGHVQIYK